LSFTLGLTTLAFIVAKTGRDALFFQGSGGLLQLPLIYINIAAASLPLAMLFVKAMKTWRAAGAAGLAFWRCNDPIGSRSVSRTRGQLASARNVHVHPGNFRRALRQPLASRF
jgi:hypothetical protein